MAAKGRRYWVGILVIAAVIQWPALCIALSGGESSPDTTQDPIVSLVNGAAPSVVPPARHDPPTTLERLSRDTIGCPLVRVIPRLRLGHVRAAIQSDLARPDFDCLTCASLCRFVV